MNFGLDWFGLICLGLDWTPFALSAHPRSKDTPLRGVELVGWLYPVTPADEPTLVALLPWVSSPYTIGALVALGRTGRR